ncbi:hypothetical protein [Thermococcus sp. 21S9]|uniref:hypothetical protein n=1 Tax=Thermococcus sp. 21S9 TaxID=1638223 RepID=UPI001438C28C|nr:hypothetical protein [Thermococcus sp. 21S9]NJE54959.1 hypothetical protein [Thermococcus sp. 21S9]
MCVATVKLTTPNVTKTIKVTEVLLDGRPVWPCNIDGRKASTNPYVVTPVIKLKPTNVYEDTTITMTLNDNFEVYYFGHDYLREAICGELRRGTHLITVIFDNNASISETFEIKG